MLSALGVPAHRGHRFLPPAPEAILKTSGGLLVAFGLLLVTNRVHLISAVIQRWMDAAGLQEPIGL